MYLIYNPSEPLSMYYSIKHQNDPLILSTIEDCKNYNTTIQKVYCVKGTSGFFKYNVSNRFVSPQEMVVSGGNCQAWSYFYAEVFNKLDLDTKFVSLHNHLYIVVFDNNYYCSLDQENIHCIINSNQENEN